MRVHKDPVAIGSHAVAIPDAIQSRLGGKVLAQDCSSGRWARRRRGRGHGRRRRLRWRLRWSALSREQRRWRAGRRRRRCGRRWRGRWLRGCAAFADAADRLGIRKVPSVHGAKTGIVFKVATVVGGCPDVAIAALVDEMGLCWIGHDKGVVTRYRGWVRSAGRRLAGYRRRRERRRRHWIWRAGRRRWCGRRWRWRRLYVRATFARAADDIWVDKGPPVESTAAGIIGEEGVAVVMKADVVFASCNLDKPVGALARVRLNRVVARCRRRRGHVGWIVLSWQQRWRTRGRGRRRRPNRSHARTGDAGGVATLHRVVVALVFNVSGIGRVPWHKLPLGGGLFVEADTRRVLVGAHGIVADRRHAAVHPRRVVAVGLRNDEALEQGHGPVALGGWHSGVHFGGVRVHVNVRGKTWIGIREWIGSGRLVDDRRDDPPDALCAGAVDAVKVDGAGCRHDRPCSCAAILGRVGGARVPILVTVVVHDHGVGLLTRVPLWGALWIRIVGRALPRAAQVDGIRDCLRVVMGSEARVLLAQHGVQHVARAGLVECKRVDREVAGRVWFSAIFCRRVAAVAKVRHKVLVGPRIEAVIGKAVHAAGMCIVIGLPTPALAIGNATGKVVELKDVAGQVAAHVPTRVERVRPWRGGTIVAGLARLRHSPHALAKIARLGTHVGVVPDLVAAVRLDGVLLGIAATRLDVGHVLVRCHLDRVPR